MVSNFFSAASIFLGQQGLVDFFGHLPSLPIGWRILKFQANSREKWPTQSWAHKTLTANSFYIHHIEVNGNIIRITVNLCLWKLCLFVFKSRKRQKIEKYNPWLLVMPRTVQCPCKSKKGQTIISCHSLAFIGNFFSSYKNFCKKPLVHINRISAKYFHKITEKI